MSVLDPALVLPVESREREREERDREKRRGRQGGRERQRGGRGGLLGHLVQTFVPTWDSFPCPPS